MAKNNKTRFFYALYSDKTRVFDQSERAYYPSYIIKIYIYIYLTIILLGRAGYEMIYNQLGATRLVGYDHFISSKPE